MSVSFSRTRRVVRAAVIGGAILGAGALFAPRGAFASGGDAHEGAEDAHGEHSINWVYGFLGEKEGIDHPDWMYRHPGMPVPLGAYLINTSILFYLLFRIGKKPALDGLKSRRERIMKGMEEAAKMNAEAAEQLAKYQGKLDQVDAEVARIQKEMREAAEVERASILAEAKQRRERMEKDAEQMIVQELKAAREQLLNETAASALETAEQLLAQHVNSSDHQRLSDEYLGDLESVLVNSRGGQA